VLLLLSETLVVGVLAEVLPDPAGDGFWSVVTLCDASTRARAISAIDRTGESTKSRGKRPDT
jgi:hypothetical protein